MTERRGIVESARPLVVVGFDGSTTSERAMYYAIGLARRQQASLLAVHALPLPVDLPAVDLPATSEDVASALGCSFLEGTVQELMAESGVPVTFMATAGEPAGVLSRVASEHRADALVVGASTRPVHRLFGSVATRAVRRCPCPVTVVP